tara:strand:- start:2279 stop:2458 length:180 start_codon:yes stop_codon:yes gene_type:complete
MTATSPVDTIQTMQRIISDQSATARVTAWAKRKIYEARTEQLKQECAPMLKIKSGRHLT